MVKPVQDYEYMSGGEMGHRPPKPEVKMVPVLGRDTKPAGYEDFAWGQHQLAKARMEAWGAKEVGYINAQAWGPDHEWIEYYVENDRRTQWRIRREGSDGTINGMWFAVDCVNSIPAAGRKLVEWKGVNPDRVVSEQRKESVTNRNEMRSINTDTDWQPSSEEEREIYNMNLGVAPLHVDLGSMTADEYNNAVIQWARIQSSDMIKGEDTSVVKKDDEIDLLANSMWLSSCGLIASGTAVAVAFLHVPVFLALLSGWGLIAMTTTLLKKNV